ncbi:MAG TPA: HU family DNA-binding protein [Bacilli bacterium]|nr:MAG: Integration host factor subunit alpha [Tenericutes bacterium ADurb.BinA124]HNZ50653.1 HU family DNA-binding protein [Bacilli bacterium]HPN60933.1 HU family DNA-binding protein [Bacilli bacterium]HPX84678.1 HU family DNA-binding protein [Bacilli bacterium]HQC74716.1 HU family DNA-binding protein [Bacilli bacterium]
MKRAIYLEAIKQQTGLTKKAIDQVIDCYFTILTTTLKTNQKASITNFGTFTLKPTKPFTYFSPVDGSTLSTLGINKIYFSSSKALLKKVAR